VGSRDAREFWGEAAGGREAKGRGPFVRSGRAVAAFLLAGLTSIEVIVLAVTSVSAVGFLWMADILRPESLVTDRLLRAAWIVLVLSILRPITWIPYWLTFLGLQAVADAIMPHRSLVLRNCVANLGTLAVLGLIVGLVFATVSGASTAVLSFLAFLTGSVALEDLGAVAGDWDLARIAAVVAGALLLRILLPPLDTDLDLSDEPILGFASGARGRADRVLLIAVVAAAAVLVGVGAILAAAGQG
jgi:hypothetical protein